MPAGADVESTKQLDRFREETKKKAESLVLTEFPKRICALNQLLDDPKFNLANFHDIHADVNIPVPDAATFFPDLVKDGSGDSKSKKRKLEDGATSSNDVVNDVDDEDVLTGEPPRTIPGTKIYLLPNGSSPCNPKLRELMGLIKPRLRQLVDDANVLKMWISFLIPKIEDGNNFGVGVQEDTLGEIRAVESEAAAFYDGIARYFSTRASVISKMIKFPHVDDYRQVIRELDEKEYFSLRLVLCEVRNHYALLHDIITKNLDKIRKPRSQHVDNLY